MREEARRFQEALHRINRSMGTDFLEKITVKITGPQIFMLYFINERGSCKLAQLAEELEVKPSAVTVMIDRLVKSGYVERMQDTADRRAVLVKATSLGQEVLEQALRHQLEITGEYLSRLEPHEARLLTELLEKLATDGTESKNEKH